MNQIEKVARALCRVDLGNMSDEVRAQWLVDGLWERWATYAKAAIAAMPVQAEPVAWMYQVRRVTNFSVSRARDTFPEEQGWTETPLYALPTPPAGGSDAE